MALTTGPNLDLLVDGEPDDEHFDELMQLWRGIDGLLQPVVASLGVNTPPTPANGLMVIVGDAGTGIFEDKEGDIARFYTAAVGGSGCEFYTPKVGWTVAIADTLVDGVPVKATFTETGWVINDGLPSELYSNIYTFTGSSEEA
jgi:hypothetical protein